MEAMKTQLDAVGAYDIVPYPTGNYRIIPENRYLTSNPTHIYLCGTGLDGLSYPSSQTTILQDYSHWPMKMRRFDIISAYLNAQLNNRKVLMKMSTNFEQCRKVYLR